jgi:hypothetical protein
MKYFIIFLLLLAACENVDMNANLSDNSTLIDNEENESENSSQEELITGEQDEIVTDNDSNNNDNNQDAAENLVNQASNNQDGSGEIIEKTPDTLKSIFENSQAIKCEYDAFREFQNGDFDVQISAYIYEDIIRTTTSRKDSILDHDSLKIGEEVFMALTGDENLIPFPKQLVEITGCEWLKMENSEEIVDETLTLKQYEEEFEEQAKCELVTPEEIVEPSNACTMKEIEDRLI